MTEQATFATFDSDLPDDSEFSDAGDIVIPGGRGLSEVLTQAFERQGFNVLEWNQYEFYGWQTTLELSGQKCWILLQGGRPWLLIAENRSGILSWIHKTGDAFRETLLAIDTALKDEDRIKNVSWFSRAEYEKGSQVGSARP